MVFEILHNDNSRNFDDVSLLIMSCDCRHPEGVDVQRSVRCILDLFYLYNFGNYTDDVVVVVIASKFVLLGRRRIINEYPLVLF